MTKETINTTTIQNIFRVLLAVLMIFAGYSHLTFNRVDFQAQVPDWVPVEKDLVVVLSGVVEMILGLLLLFWKQKRTTMGWVLAVFFILVFPGNIAQYVDKKDAFGALNSDTARLARLFFQPVLIIWSIWSSGAWRSYKISQSKK